MVSGSNTNNLMSSSSTNNVFSSHRRDAAALQRQAIHEQLQGIKQRNTWGGTHKGAIPATFSGKHGEDVEGFATIYEECVDANDWDEEMALKTLPYFLEDRAKRAFDSAVESRVDKWEIQQEEQALSIRKATAKLQNVKDELETLEEKKTALKREMIQAIVAAERDENQSNAVDATMENITGVTVEIKEATDKLTDLTKNLKVLQVQGEDTQTRNPQTPIQKAFISVREALDWVIEAYEERESKEMFFAQYATTKQRQGERVRDYADRLLYAYRRSRMRESEGERTKRLVKGMTLTMKAALRQSELYGVAALTKEDMKDWDAVMRTSRELERRTPSLIAKEAMTMGGANDSDASAQGLHAMGTEDDHAKVETVAAMQKEADGDKATNEILKTLIQQVESLTKQVQSPTGSREGRTNQYQQRGDTCTTCGQYSHSTAECTPEIRAKMPPCFVCGLQGHYSRVCEQRKARTWKAAPATPNFCSQCGERGHAAAVCPTQQGNE